MKIKYICIFILIAVLMTSGITLAKTAEEIMNRRDDNEFYTSARIEGKMIVINRDRRIERDMISISDGENALTRFTNPADRGTKFLKKGDELYMFFPDAEEVVHVSGHMLNNSMMGSDFSYKDMMESEELTELYNFEITGEEEYQERTSYIIEGRKVEGKEDVQYYRRKIWVDKERFIALREELYAESGRLLKVLKVTEVKKFKDRWFPMKTVMENKLRRDSTTEFIINDIKFDPEIPEGTFTMENLQS